jgi:hypothetical protein
MEASFTAGNLCSRPGRDDHRSRLRHRDHHARVRVDATDRATPCGQPLAHLPDLMWSWPSVGGEHAGDTCGMPACIAWILPRVSGTGVAAEQPPPQPKR